MHLKADSEHCLMSEEEYLQVMKVTEQENSLDISNTQ
jgi:hypothetical protein